MVVTDDERSSGKIVQVDLSKVQLCRPETPQSSGLRKTFIQGDIRPNTMENKLDSPRSDEDQDAKVEIGKLTRTRARCFSLTCASLF